VSFDPIAQLPVDPQACRIYAEGWQSWSPTRTYRFGKPVQFPSDPNVVALGYRADRPPGPHPQGEGLLAVWDGAASHVFHSPSLPSIRAVADGAELRIEATAGVGHQVVAGELPAALGSWGEQFARGVVLRQAPTVWCSWYQYFTSVAESDIAENLQAMDRQELPIDVVQIDDGYESEIGDWLSPSEKFGSLPAMVQRIRSFGRRPGIWVAPFLVGQRSKVAAEHPDWLVPGATAGWNWDQPLRVLDVGHPAAEAWLREVFQTLAGWGFGYFKIDFAYAGALPGIDHYRHGLRVIREAIGDAYLVGCGAPILPSVGLVDAMRVSPDTASHFETTAGDLSQPGQRAAIGNGEARAWQHGRFWVNDPDCILARPGVERREQWAQHIARVGGLRASSDRLSALDEWGLATTRRLLTDVPAPLPFEVG
jgi:alpha-galactosidase